MASTDDDTGLAPAAPVGGGHQAAVDVVMAFLACGGRRDFSAARPLLAEGVTRVGPDGDIKTGRDEYLAYLEQVLAGASDYRYQVARAVPSADGRTVLVELDESLVEAGGNRVAVTEAMVFDLTPDLRVGRLSVYMKVPPGSAP
jgi:limonene-1,2-epoxide hydrolase